ncbi:hypothetical protein MUK42_00774 [Musa troglodytarum]|uniref:Uncharacterized protein n=1 Tax=Musa troglodytarum TaxID=320322 RepID=A0A9E7JU46_9LILI|nr:hypothetical protein MUK42_00774 [Musa troglodytarum]
MNGLSRTDTSALAPFSLLVQDLMTSITPCFWNLEHRLRQMLPNSRMESQTEGRGAAGATKPRYREVMGLKRPSSSSALASFGNMSALTFHEPSPLGLPIT